MNRKIAIVAVLISMIMIITGCSGGSGGSAKYTGKNAAGVTEYYLYNKDEDHAQPGTPDRTLDPAEVYKNIEYIPEMLYGRYQLTGGDKAIEKYRDEMDYMEFAETNSVGTSNVRNITAIPYEIYSGPENMSHRINTDKTHNWLNAYFQDDKGNLLMEIFAYEVEGHTLRMVHLKSFEYDEASNTVAYELDDLVLEYGFEFDGTALTLLKDGKSVRMNAGYNYGDEAQPHYCIEHYIAPGDELLDNIFYIAFLKDREEKNVRLYFYYYDKDSEKQIMRKAYGTFAENGLFTFTIPFEDGEKTYQYVFFYLEYDGLILTDGENVYKFMTKWADYRNMKLQDVLDEDTDPDTIPDSTAEELIETQEDILEELEDAFRDNDIVADIDPETGRVTMDTNILFATDSAEISDEGKANLDRFAKVYGDVIINRIKEGSVAHILVEGHTDTNGTYEYNQQLSEQRAKAVCDYCASIQPDMSQYLNAKGYAYDRPVYDESGNVDMAASRRVVFKFILNIKQ